MSLGAASATLLLAVERPWLRGGRGAAGGGDELCRRHSHGVCCLIRGSKKGSSPPAEQDTGKNR